jgi:hypothetical protein
MATQAMLSTQQNKQCRGNMRELFFVKKEGQYGPVDTLMRQTRIQYPGATLGGRAGRYPICAVKGMS